MRLDARATRPERDTATFTGGVLRYFAGANRTTPLDSIVFGGDELNGAFGGVTFGRPATATLMLRSGVPFAAEFGFRYRVRGRERATDPTRFVCGPPPAGTGEPRIGAVSFAPSPAAPGERIRLRFDYSAPAGLWAAVVTVQGAFGADTTLHGGFSAGGTQEIDFIVPREAVLGAGSQLSIALIDVAAQIAEQTGIQGPIVQDGLPPQLTEASLANSGGLTQVPSGAPVPLTFRATENGRLRWLIYEFGRPFSHRDSVEIVADGSVMIGVLREWSGETALTVWVRDAAGNLSNPLEAGRVRVYPSCDYPTRSAPFARPEAFVRSVDERSVYLSMAHGGLIRLAPATLQSEQILSGDIRAFDLTPGQDTAWVVQGQEVTWISLADPAHRGSVRLPGVLQNSGVHRIPGGDLLVTSSGPRRLSRVRPRTGSVEPLIEEPGDSYGPPVARTAGAWDRSFTIGVVGEGCGWSLAAGQVSPNHCLPIPLGPLTSSRDGSRYAAATVPLDPSGRPLPEWEPSPWARATAISPDGRSVYQLVEGGVDRIPIEAPGRPAERLPLPVVWDHSEGLMFFVGERHLLVFSHGRIFVIDLPAAEG